MTANAFDDDVKKSKAAGMNAHLAKPIEPERLYRTLYDFIYSGEESVYRFVKVQNKHSDLFCTFFVQSDIIKSDTQRMTFFARFPFGFDMPHSNRWKNGCISCKRWRKRNKRQYS